MTSSNNPRGLGPDNATSLSQAIADIDEIRTHIAAGALFRGFGPLVIAMTGALALVTMFSQLRWPHFLARDHERFLFVWIAVAGFSIILVGVEMIARSRRHHGGLADAMIFKAIEQFVHIGLAGAAMGFVFWRFADDMLWVLPGMWQVMVGVGIFASLRTLPKSIALTGGWYFLSGLIVLVIASETREVAPVLMGLPFLGGQLIMAACLYLAGRDFSSKSSGVSE